ncbi:MAG TPA: DEAD/DEAH box helicase [Anaerolineaceae bacterium]|nr:DEAD/DEAH box helicase [Anaerolineaceae bacterium]HPN52446.1 DEAD/DEAH box helicase [Anaerolineaceae bacterium]
MTTEFALLNLHPQLVQAVNDRGYEAPMPIQSAVIPLMLAGHDVIGQAQTGTGKTAAFALPILNNLEPNQPHVQALVLTPTRELALQVAEAMISYGTLSKARVLAVYGGQAYGPQIYQLRQGVDVVVGTPGRLMDLIHRGVLNLSAVRTVVLDEADEMLSMGFVEDIELILAETPAERQTALFSATMPAEIRALANTYMKDPCTIAIKAEQVTVDTIEQRAYWVRRDDKIAALTRLFETEEITSALIFARTRIGTSELATALAARNFPAEVLNGDLSQDAREHTLNRFRQGKTTVLVATDVAARGLDIEGISHVFNFDLPEDAEVYVHRIGRTGRAGRSGVAISLVAPSEKHRLRQIEALLYRKLTFATLPTEAEIMQAREDRLAKQVLMWLQRGRCKQERAIIDRFAAEGYDPIDIATAALKLARLEDKQRPIMPMDETPVMVDRPRAERGRSDRGERPERPERPAAQKFGRALERAEAGSRWAAVSHEEGMVRLSLNTGRQAGIRVNDVVGAIAAHANIPGRVIGKISIQDRFTLVDVPEEFAGQVLAQSGDLRIRKQAIAVQRAQ